MEESEPCVQPVQHLRDHREEDGERNFKPDYIKYPLKLLMNLPVAWKFQQAGGGRTLR